MRPTAGKAAFRPAQNGEPLRLVVRHAAARRAVRRGDRLHPLQEMRDLALRPVELDDQQRLHVERIAGVHEILGRVDRRPVHHLHAAGDDPGADDVGDAAPGVLARGEADQRGARRLRRAQDAHRHLGHDAEQALRAGHQAEQVVAVGIEMLAAEPDHLAGDQHHLDAEHVVGGQAVFQAVHAAGILRHVAADRAGDLRRGVGRIVEAAVGRRRWSRRDW